MIKHCDEIDILMATFNGERYLSDQIESILNQTHRNFNLIIFDDNSTDSTIDILLDYQSKDSRIRVFQNKENVGVIKNFENLIEKSNSDYFMLCDQDDVWDKDKIRKSLQHIIKEETLLAFSDLTVADDKLSVINPSFLKYQNINIKKTIGWKTLLIQNVVTGCTIIANKALKKSILPFPENIVMHDSWLALNAAIYDSVSFINESLVLYRQHNSNVIGASNSESRNSRGELTYSTYITQRLKIIEDLQKILISYRLRINHFKVLTAINDINIRLEYFKKVNFFGFGFIGFFYKYKYSSIGISRNIWWILYLEYPLVSYLIVKIKNITFGGK